MGERRRRHNGPLARWHRRLGVAAAAFVLLLCVTGALLNHTDALGLDRRPVPDALTAWLGGRPAPALVHFAAADRSLTQLGEALFWGTVRLPDPRGRVRGAVAFDDLTVAAADDTLLLVDDRGRLVERLGRAEGVPGGIRRIGRAGDGRLVVQTEAGALSVDVEALDWQPRRAVQSVLWSTPSPAPERLRARLLARYVGPRTSWEQALRALHTGRVLGWWGALAMDLAAMGFTALAISGLWLWTRR